jgi:hypothetical protein
MGERVGERVGAEVLGAPVGLRDGDTLGAKYLVIGMKSLLKSMFAESSE